MFPRWTCRLVVALLLPVLAEPALAQIPGSELPGRAREEFKQPRAPLAQPGAPVVSLPSTVAPEGAEKLMVTVRGFRITGSTIYSAADLEPLYADLVGREVAGHRDLRSRAAHHHEIRRRRLRALARDRAAAGTDPARRRRAHPDHRRLYRQGRMAAVAVEVPRLLLATTPPRSPPSGRSTSRRSSATCCWRATSPACGSPTACGPPRPSRAPPRWWSRSWRSRSTIRPRRQPRHQGARARCSISTASTSTISAACTKAGPSATAGAFQVTELQYWMASYRQVLTSEGLTLFVNNNYTRSKPGTESCSSWNTRPAATCSKPASAIRSSASARRT